MNLLDFIFPKRCVGCRKFGKYFCNSCRLRIRPILVSETICPVCEHPAVAGFTHPICKTRYSPNGLTSFFHYKGVVGSAVRTIKYRFAFDVATEFVSFIPNALVEDIPYEDATQWIFVPIPLHKKRLHDRGFNQAEVLGKFVSKRLQVPMAKDILFRTRETIPQVEIKYRKDRLKNMHNVFMVNLKEKMSVVGKNIVLFDDVFTTGATMREAAKVLKNAGAKRVWLVTMAR